MQQTVYYKPLKSRSTAILLALFLGGFGIHKFYLGQPGLGILYLLFCWTFIPGLVALIEVVMLLFTSDQAFNERYNPITMIHATGTP